MNKITLNEAIVKVAQEMKKYIDINYQSKSDDSLNTNDKTIVGAINEILNNSSSAFGEKQVFNANTRYDFPSIGSTDVIYKAYEERKTYQWNAERLVY